MTQQKRRGRPPKVKVEPVADKALPAPWAFMRGVLFHGNNVRGLFDSEKDALVYLEKIRVIKA